MEAGEDRVGHWNKLDIIKHDNDTSFLDETNESTSMHNEGTTKDCWYFLHCCHDLKCRS